MGYCAHNKLFRIVLWCQFCYSDSELKYSIAGVESDEQFLVTDTGNDIINTWKIPLMPNYLRDSDMFVFYSIPKLIVKDKLVHFCKHVLISNEIKAVFTQNYMSIYKLILITIQTLSTTYSNLTNLSAIQITDLPRA